MVERKETPQSHFFSNFTCRRIAHRGKGSVKTRQADRSRPTKKQDQRVEEIVIKHVVALNVFNYPLTVDMNLGKLWEMVRDREA